MEDELTGYAALAAAEDEEDRAYRAAMRARRCDPEFMRRIRHSMERNQRALERLAGAPTSSDLGESSE